VLLALPGAFTPTCSSTHLPGYDKHYEEFKKLGIDEVICLSVNDAFVMFQWAKHLGIQHPIFMLPDGNGDFTKGVGMLVKKVLHHLPSHSQLSSLLSLFSSLHFLFSYITF
jgi:peroxiredoxin